MEELKDLFHTIADEINRSKTALEEMQKSNKSAYHDAVANHLQGSIWAYEHIAFIIEKKLLSNEKNKY